MLLYQGVIMGIFKIKRGGVFAALLLLCHSALGATHTVKAKETFYSIAKRHGVSVAALMSQNGMSDPRKLYVGKRLVIPGKASTSQVKTKPKGVHRKVAAKTARYYPSSSKFRVIVDAGHGGRDMGAYWYGVRESNLNIKVARKVEAGLRARGYPVTMTRRSDVFISLSRRSQIANRYRNAIFVSIHFNATKHTRVSGAETYYAGRKGRYLAKCIQSQMVRRLRVKNRGVRRGRYAVLVGTRCPAVLVECGFISNTRERRRCNTARFQTDAARSIVAGIERYDRVY